jgi:hypothetical protein
MFLIFHCGPFPVQLSSDKQALINNFIFNNNCPTVVSQPVWEKKNYILGFLESTYPLMTVTP